LKKMSRIEKRVWKKDLYDNLMVDAISEIDAILIMDMDGIVDPTIDYEWLTSELARMKKSSPERKFYIVYRFDKPERLAIYTSAEWEHHPLTIQSSENEKKRKQKESLRKRINDNNKVSQKPKFSIVED